jgi:S-DNA-T family DNA segregation ATPase FtsK/SpoIIIE
LAIFITTLGVSGIAQDQNLNQNHLGLFGMIAKLLVNGFGLLVANIVFATIILIGLFIFLQFVWQEVPEEEKKEAPVTPTKSTDAPTFKIKGIEDKPEVKQAKPSLFKVKDNSSKEPKAVSVPLIATEKGNYSLPPVDLLSRNETVPQSGNIKENSSIIKKTLENFGIPVEMAEVNVGPAVTQYAFKPAEGVKLSKITTLSNNLALALAAHPIRIEAPIPGKSLVGIEVPNKVRATVVLRNLVADNTYQQDPAHLLIALGKDVSGLPVYTDLSEMPHMLVAGATGTGKTIFLNSLILMIVLLPC